MNVFNNYNCTHICFHLQLSNLRLHIWLSSGYFCKFIIHENTPDILQKMKWYGYFDFILYCKLHVVHVKTRHLTAVNRHFSFNLSGSSVIILCLYLALYKTSPFGYKYIILFGTVTSCMVACFSFTKYTSGTQILSMIFVSSSMTSIPYDSLYFNRSSIQRCRK